MQPIQEAASEFLAETKRIAVTGVSSTPKTHGSNTVYRRLRDRGYEVRGQPERKEVEGDRCYPDLKSIREASRPLIGNRSEIAEKTMRECAELGIKHVWMHWGAGSAASPPRPPTMAGSTDHGDRWRVPP